MTIFDSLILGALQGITEFLPISSSGHLILGEYFLDLKVEQLKSFDIAVHVASLLAILIYFRNDFLEIIINLGNKKGQTMAMKLILGTIPAVIIGFTLGDQIDLIFRNPKAVTSVMIIIGFLFFAAEKWPTKKDKTELNWKNALVIGLAQSIAIIPGISRSGSTITAGLFQGIKREDAAKFSFILGSIAIFGAGLLTALKDSQELTETIKPEIMISGFLSALIFSLLSVSWLMKFLKSHKLNVFGIYLVGIGSILLLSSFS